MKHRKVFVLLLIILLGCVGTASASNSSDEQLAKQLQTYLESKNSPLAPHAKAIVYWGKFYGIDPRFVVAVSGGESAFGRKLCQRGGAFNAWGMGPCWDFKSWPHGIKSTSYNLGENYRNRKTIPNIREKWAPSGVANDPTNLNSHWVKNVSHYYRELGGDPNGNVFVIPKVKTAPKDEDEKYIDSLFLSHINSQAVRHEKAGSHDGVLVLFGCVILAITILFWPSGGNSRRRNNRRWASYSNQRRR